MKQLGGRRCQRSMHNPCIDHYRSGKRSAMYLSATLGQPQGQGSCSWWERNAEFFSKVIAEHHLLTEFGRSIRAIRQPYRVTAATTWRTTWRVNFPNKVAVWLSLANVPDFVAAVRRYPDPPGPVRYYTYSCKRDGTLVFRKRKPPP
jgi:hypothetical protein